MERGGPEQLQQVRLALGGLRLGALLLAVVLLMWPLVLWPLTAAADSSEILAAEAVMGLISCLGLAAPFAGVAPAISRQGLWDIDFLFRRTTLYAVLGALFLGLWVGLEPLFTEPAPSRHSISGIRASPTWF